MKQKLFILIIPAIILLFSCTKWEEHYNSASDLTDENVWDAIKKNSNLSSFVSYMEKYQFDTLFITNNTYTLFIPDNDAFTRFLSENDSISQGIIAYHVSKHFIQTTAIQGIRKVQTFNEKFAFFNNQPGGLYLDNIPITFQSPLYLNGRYFIMNQVAAPPPNLYEYIAVNNRVLRAYIDSQDSVLLDLERSKPIGFDDNGNTIYDTVAQIVNKFEMKFFEVSEEFRNKTATFAFPNEENYNEALTELALKIGSGYSSYEDIPLKWQEEELIPYLLERGMFDNLIEREEFIKKGFRDTVRLMNLLGDSVDIDYVPGPKVLCSNGYAYDYVDFHVPDTFYRSPVRFEMERLVQTRGSIFAWYPWVKQSSSTNFMPYKDHLSSASNDTSLRVSFTRGYRGTFQVEFNVDNLFPRKYLMVCRINPVRGGIYDIYVNGQLVRTFDYGTEISSYYVVNSVIPNKRYFPDYAGWTKFDCWIDGQLTEYGKAKIKFVYKGPGTVVFNEFSMDYIDFDPEW